MTASRSRLRGGARIVRVFFVLVAFSLLWGCAPKENMLRDTELLRARAGQIRATQKSSLELGGPVCGLRELAIAESHRLFAVYELEQGHYPRYLRHVAYADEHLKLAWAKARACEPPDRDGDGVPDHLDHCPNHPGDPEGRFGPVGCPVPDKDQDGIPNHLDKCPTEPEDYDGFQDDDGCPEPDNDGDGVPDLLDHCPNHPGDPEGRFGPVGCPTPDKDQDGIPDHLDKCPTEPQTYTDDADYDGCPVVTYKSIEVTEKEIRIKETIFFATNRAVILPQSFPLLDEVVQALNTHATITVEVGGHTDNVGSPAYNKRLSQQRADSVRKYLVDKGIDESRLTAVGYGEEQPLESNRTAAGRAKNRRVEFRILSR